MKHTGDGMLARFDSPGRAVSCARHHRQVGALGVRVRSGIRTGEVELRGSGLSGLAVHIASRVMDAATDGEVLVSRTVKDLTIGADLSFADPASTRSRESPAMAPLRRPLTDHCSRDRAFLVDVVVCDLSSRYNSSNSIEPAGEPASHGPIGGESTAAKSATASSTCGWAPILPIAACS